MQKTLFILMLFAVVISCKNNTKKKMDRQSMKKESFGYDREFLHRYHKDMIVLGDENSASRIIVLPAYQGRVMTSTAEGDEGMSFGWINHELIASGKFTEHFSAFGGEDRLWLGPEGGQYSIYFKEGADFTFENWYVPKEFDTEPFDLVSSNTTEASFEKKMHLKNYSGSSFDLRINRKVRMLGSQVIKQLLNGGKIPDGIKIVGFQTENTITNEGQNTWDRSSGMLSLWVLSMLRAADGTTIFIPYQQGDSSALGKVMTADYFGEIPPERLKADSGMIRFKADGNLRSKIGISPKRTIPRAASFDAVNNVLTIALFSFDSEKKDYVNSLWKIQEDPFSGDVVNAYNDGPVEGKQMGKFYELESSSPAAALKPGEKLTHTHSTIHLKGDRTSLDQLARELFGVGLDAIELN